MRPTTEIAAAIEGSLSPEQLAPASSSALRFNVYKIACVILKTPGNEPKRQAIDHHPVTLQPLIRKECRRIYNLRRGIK